MDEPQRSRGSKIRKDLGNSSFYNLLEFLGNFNPNLVHILPLLTQRKIHLHYSIRKNVDYSWYRSENTKIMSGAEDRSSNVIGE